MLEIRDLTVRFGGVTPLQDLSMELSGAICGVIGPNGAGKTTLLNVLSGLVRPAEGTIHVDGFDLAGTNAAGRARWGLARTFQQEAAVAELTVGENVQVAAEHAGHRHDRGVSADEALALTGLAGSESRPVRTLSARDRRLLEIARAIATRPRLVLLDEPGAGLSPTETAELAGVLSEVQRQSGAMLVLVDHDMEFVRSTCERIAVLDFGRLIALGETAEVLADARVRAAYLGTEDVTTEAPA